MDASTWIGQSDPKSDKLDLRQIRENLPNEAAALKAILNEPTVTVSAEERVLRARRAARAQRTFEQLTFAAVSGSAVAALASGVLLYGVGNADTETAAQPA